MTDTQRIEMLTDFVIIAMGEDCLGTALSYEMEKVEQWIAAHYWLIEHAETADPEVVAEEREVLAEAERWWLTVRETRQGTD